MYLELHLNKCLDFFGGSEQPRELVRAVYKETVILATCNQRADLTSISPKSHCKQVNAWGFPSAVFWGFSC